MQPFYVPICTSSYGSSTLAVPLFDSQQVIVPDLFDVEPRFFLWPFVAYPFPFLVNPSLWGFNTSPVIYFFFYNEKKLRYASLSIKINWHFFYPMLFLTQSKDPPSLLFVQIQPDHFSQLNLITSPEPIETEQVKPSGADRKVIFEEVSVSELKLVGLFLDTQSKKGWGIVQKANEQINKVEIGDLLGFERYIVMAIELKKIIVQASDMKETIQLLL